jgi:hypothetical protein
LPCESQVPKLAPRLASPPLASLASTRLGCPRLASTLLNSPKLFRFVWCNLCPPGTNTGHRGLGTRHSNREDQATRHSTPDTGRRTLALARRQDT